MNYLDFIIIGLIALGFVLGFKDGLVRKIIGIMGIFLGIFLAVKFSGNLGSILSPVLDQEKSFAVVIAGIAIFVITIVAASLLKRWIHPHDKVNKFINQFLGGLAGGIQLVFFISAFLLVLHIFKYPDQSAAGKSLLYKPVYGVLPKTAGFMVGGKDFVKDFIEKIDADSSSVNKINEKLMESPKTEITKNDKKPVENVKAKAQKRKKKNDKIEG